MRLRNALYALVVVAAATGCGRDKGYVRTSLDTQRGFQRTAAEVHVSEKGRGNSAELKRELIEIQELLGKREFAAAKRSASAVVKRDPGSIDGHTYLAVALENTGDAGAAGSHYLRAAELAPGNGAALSNYGAWLCGQGRADESLAWFDRAIALPGYGNKAMAVANAGVCAARAGQDARADRDLRRALALDPVNTVALGALARRELQAGRAFEARAFSERRLAAAPADAQALLLASQIEHKLGDMAAAARYVERLNAEFPDALEARNSATGEGGSR